MMCIEIAPFFFPFSTSIENADLPLFFMYFNTVSVETSENTRPILKCQVRTSEEALKVVSTLSSERNIEEFISLVAFNRVATEDRPFLLALSKPNHCRSQLNGSH